VGGEEFMPGNELQDELLVRAARRLGEDRPAFVIATAAVLLPLGWFWKASLLPGT